MNSKQIFTLDYSCIDKNAHAGAVMNALVAYARSRGAKKNHLTSSGEEMTEKGIAIQALVAAVVTLAADEGVVVTVDNRVRAERPITGQFDTIIETRWARRIYQHYYKLRNPDLVAKTVDELNLELGKIQKLGGAQAWNGERYAEVGFMIGAVELETEAQLAEYILNVALVYDLDLFKDVVKTPVRPIHHEKPTIGLMAAPSGPTFVDPPSRDPMEVLKELVDVSPLSISGLSPVAMGHPPLVVLETIGKLAARGSPLATKLAEKAYKALPGSQDSRVLASMATMLTFADKMALIKNSIESAKEVPLVGDFGAYDHPYLTPPPHGAVGDPAIPVRFNDQGGLDYYPV